MHDSHSKDAALQEEEEVSVSHTLHLEIIDGLTKVQTPHTQCSSIVSTTGTVFNTGTVAGNSGR